MFRPSLCPLWLNIYSLKALQLSRGTAYRVSMIGKEIYICYLCSINDPIKPERYFFMLLRNIFQFV